MKPKYIDDNVLTYCRFIKDKKTVAELQVPDMVDFSDVKRLAAEKNIDYEYFFIFYVEENNQIRHYNYSKDRQGSLGSDSTGKCRYLFNHLTNDIIVKLNDSQKGH